MNKNFLSFIILLGLAGTLSAGSVVYQTGLNLTVTRTNLVMQGGEYSFVSVNLVSATLYVKNREPGSLIFKCGTFSADSLSRITLSTMGAAGTGKPSYGTNYGDAGGGGGYGGAGGDGGGVTGSGGPVFDDYVSSLLSEGSVGGDGLADNTYPLTYAGKGGFGGGRVVVFATNSIVLDGAILVNGCNGGNTSILSTMMGFPMGAGGGGSGGSVLLSSPVISGSGYIMANGGNGGKGTNSDGTSLRNGGGGGGGGRVLLFSKTSSFNTSHISVTEGSGGIGMLGIAGSSGSEGSVVFCSIPELVSLGSITENDKRSYVFKLKATCIAYRTSKSLRFKIQVSADNFASVLREFDQTQDSAGWSKSGYSSGEEATFTAPAGFILPAQFQWRAIVFFGSVPSVPSAAKGSDGLVLQAGSDVTIKNSVFSPNNDGFNDFIELQISAQSGDTVSIAIFNLSGRKVRTLSREAPYWNGTDDMGDALPAGMYIVQVRVGSKLSTGLVSLVK